MIALQKLMKIYQMGDSTVHALDGVSLFIGQGEFVAITGPSGSGKSTFLRTLNRLEKHDGGRIVIDGIELNDELKHLCAVRREVGMVFQNFNLFSHLTILRNITLAPMRVRKMPCPKSCLIQRKKS